MALRTKLVHVVVPEQRLVAVAPGEGLVADGKVRAVLDGQLLLLVAVAVAVLVVTGAAVRRDGVHGVGGHKEHARNSHKERDVFPQALCTL